MSLIFEWDPRKAVINRRKHRVSFDEAKTIFRDPYELMIPDPAHSSERGQVDQYWGVRDATPFAGGLH